MTVERLAERINALRWFHSIDFGSGLVSPGDKPLETIKAEQVKFLEPILLEGASLIDVGAWNGAFSFEAARRGARVLATDHFVWRHEGWRGREGFDLANEALGLNVQARELDVHDITIENVGQYDVVLFLGVLYHLRSPLTLLESVAAVAKECLVVETQAAMMEFETPALAYYPGKTLLNDPSNFFAPNAAFVTEVLREIGFKIFDTHYLNGRLTVHAWRSARLRKLANAGEVHVNQTLSLPPLNEKEPELLPLTTRLKRAYRTVFPSQK